MNPTDELLRILADNQALFDAVKAKLLSKFTIKKLSHKGVDDAVLGQMARARLDGREQVEEAFADIARLKRANSQSRVNEAR